MRIRVAVCVAVDGKVLLVQHEKAGRRYWLLPGGGVELSETMLEAAGREVEEETGYRCDLGRLLVVCEAIEPAGRHIVNMVFAGTLVGGDRRVGDDRALRDVRWMERGTLPGLEFYPPIAGTIAECVDEGFTGPVRYLGNVWKERSGLG